MCTGPGGVPHRSGPLILIWFATSLTCASLLPKHRPTRGGRSCYRLSTAEQTSDGLAPSTLPPNAHLDKALGMTIICPSALLSSHSVCPHSSHRRNCDARKVGLRAWVGPASCQKVSKASRPRLAVPFAAFNYPVIVYGLKDTPVHGRGHTRSVSPLVSTHAGAQGRERMRIRWGMGRREISEASNERGPGPGGRANRGITTSYALFEG